jgi:hypothetical protein
MIFMAGILRQFLNGGDAHKNGAAAALGNTVKAIF